MPRNASPEIGQRRKYTHREVDYPSVTTILKLGTSKEWLGAWAAKLTALAANAQRLSLDYGECEHLAQCYGAKAYDELCASCLGFVTAARKAPFAKRDAAADFGTAIHSMLEVLVSDAELPEVDPRAQGHVNALVEWWNAYRPLVYESECQVINTTVGYAGSLDLIAEVYGRRLLIDLKTASTLDHTMRLQLAAYRYAEHIFVDDEQRELPIVEGCAVLWIPRDHPSEWQFIEVPAAAEAWRDFLHVKGVHDFIRRTEKTPVGELILPQAMEAA